MHELSVFGCRQRETIFYESNLRLAILPLDLLCPLRGRLRAHRARIIARSTVDHQWLLLHDGGDTARAARAVSYWGICRSPRRNESVRNGGGESHTAACPFGPMPIRLAARSLSDRTLFESRVQFNEHSHD